MSVGTTGYVTGLDYTFGYYAETNPVAARFAMVHAGLVPPTIHTACELGFGQGVGGNVHAAATAIRWFGTDFNPSHAAFARDLARASGASAQWSDQDFGEFCGRDDLPAFDFIALHGVWTWISDDTRRVLVDFIRRNLNVGGVLYISYNTQPGWATMLPVQQLLVQHYSTMGGNAAGVAPRIDAALTFVQQLFDTKPGFVQTNPLVADRLRAMAARDRHYLAHEYFNQGWSPMSIGQLGDWLAPAKLAYAGSAQFGDRLDAANLTPAQQALLASIPDVLLRETARDFCTNQPFRRDYWVRGPRRLAPMAQLEALQVHEVVLVLPREAVSMVTKGAQGETRLQEALYVPILDELADHRPHSLQGLARALASRAITFRQVVEAIGVLTGSGAVQAVQVGGAATEARERAQRLNRHVCEQSRTHASLGVVASPVTGGGVVISRAELLFLLSHMNGRVGPDAWTDDVWALLSAQGQRMTRDGRPVESDAENRAMLLEQSQYFATERVPMLVALGVCD